MADADRLVWLLLTKGNQAADGAFNDKQEIGFDNFQLGKIE